MDYNEYDNDRIENKGHLTIKVSTLIILIFILVLILPDDAFSRFAIYESTTPSYIRYKWLNYCFNVLQLLIVLFGIYVAFTLRKKGFAIVAFLMATREVFLLLLTNNSIFTSNRYEMYLTLSVGYCLLLCAEGFIGNEQDLNRLFEWFLVTNILSIYINVIMGGGSGILEGRYHASNLDVGGTGTLCVICCIYYLFSHKRTFVKILIILLSLIGLFLSGSRANLLFLILFFACYYIAITLKRIRVDEYVDRRRLLNRLIAGILIIVTLIIILILNRNQIIHIFEESRFFSMFSSSWGQDDSVLGRSASLRAGLDVLSQYPCGISGFFINLQQNMVLRGYPTFPHSTLLASYLLYGPIVFGVYAAWIITIRKINDVGNSYTWILLYFIISTIVYGGPLVNFKIIFMLMMATYLASNHSVTLGKIESTQE